MNQIFKLQAASKKIIFLFLLLFVTISYSQIKQSDTTRILFIGNSYTYYNSSPELLKALVKERFPHQVLETKLISQGGMTLKRHWEDGQALEAIKSNHWDYVVLQEQSKLGMALIIDNDIYFGKTDLFFEYAKKFDTAIKKANAKTVFFMTWSVKDHPEEQEILTHAYTKIAKELDAVLAPVGLVWDRVRTNDQFNLYDFDGSHPSSHGSYLAAITIYTTIFKNDPIGLSGKITGHKLSSYGIPSFESQPLIDIPESDAQVIQRASSAIAQSLFKKGGYPIIEKPKQSYKIPVLTKGEGIDQKNIEGRWYGTSTYGSNYLGLILDIKNIENNPEVNLSFYSPHRQERMAIKDPKIENNQLSFILIDSLRTISSHVNFSLFEDQLQGLSKSFGGNITLYKHWNLSRKNTHNKVDLDAIDGLMQSFQTDIKKEGYVEAAINHYDRYSSLIDSTFIPEEAYLNAVGYNFLREDQVNDALDIFELAMTLYPLSVNTYDSYGATLIRAGQKEKALKIYTEGSKIAKRTGDKNLAAIEANLKKLKEDTSINLEATPPPPPPPNQ